MSSSPIPIRPEPADDSDPVTERLLDAALAVFEDIGFRRATIEEIGRRVGVERITVYRRIGSKNEIVKAVTVRESQRLIARVLEHNATTDSLDERVVKIFTEGVLALRDHALFNRLMHLEPVATLPRVTTEAGPALAGVIHAISASLGPEAITRAGSLEALTGRVEIICRTAQSIIMTPQAVVDLSTPESIEHFARHFVAPIITAGPSAE